MERRADASRAEFEPPADPLREWLPVVSRRATFGRRVLAVGRVAAARSARRTSGTLPPAARLRSQEGLRACFTMKAESPRCAGRHEAASSVAPIVPLSGPPRPCLALGRRTGIDKLIVKQALHTLGLVRSDVRQERVPPRRLSRPRTPATFQLAAALSLVHARRGHRRQGDPRPWARRSSSPQERSPSALQAG